MSLVSSMMAIRNSIRSEFEEQKPEFRDSKAIFLRTANPDAHGAKEDGKYISKCYNLVSQNANHLQNNFERFILDMINKKLGLCKTKFFDINQGWSRFVVIKENQGLSDELVDSVERCMGFVEDIFKVLAPLTIDAKNEFGYLSISSFEILFDLSSIFVFNILEFFYSN